MTDGSFRSRAMTLDRIRSFPMLDPGRTGAVLISSFSYQSPFLRTMVTLSVKNT
jgi:hypothetical protein